MPIESRKILEAALGTDNPCLRRRLIDQVNETLWIPEGLGEDEKLARIASAILLLKGIKPADEIEGMLAVQMVATHNAAMDCLRRAMITSLSRWRRSLSPEPCSSRFCA